MKGVITMNNDKIVIIYKKPGKSPELKKIDNHAIEFEKLLERKV